MKWILHLKNITFKSSYNWYKIDIHQQLRPLTANYLAWLWLWLWFYTAVYEPKPSLEIVHWPSSIPVSTSGVSSGKVFPMKDFHHGCKYSTGEDLTLLGARDAIATASLRECTMCAASLATIDEFYIISRIY